MKIKLLKSVVVPGAPGAQRGQMIEVADGVAAQLKAMGAAVEVKAETLKADTLQAETIQTREPAAEVRDPIRPGKRRG